MPDIFGLIAKWWKQILTLVLLSLVITGVITYMKPNQYLSTSTAVPASAFASDRSKIFSQNIEALYSTLGTPDDLDMIVGTAKLDTVYLAVTDQYNLYDHYKVSEKGDPARTKAAFLLKSYTRVSKSEYGELKVRVWDTDKNLAPQLANSIMDVLQSMHQHLQAAGNEATLKALQSGKEKISKLADSLKNTSKDEQVRQYEKLINEYELLVDSKPPVLVVVEKAKASDWPDKPRRIQTLIAAAVLSFLFALLLALLLESRKKVTA